MAISVGRPSLERALEQGYVNVSTPSGSGLPGRMRISGEDDLFRHLLSEAYKGRLGVTQEDIIDIFQRPEEARKISRAQQNYMALLREANRAQGSGPNADLARTGVGGGRAALLRDVARQMVGGMASDEAAAGFARAGAEAARGIMQDPNRFFRSTQIQDALSRGYSDRAEPLGIAADVIEGGAQIAGAIPGPGGGAAEAGGNLLAVPFRLAQRDVLKQGQDALRRFAGDPARSSDFSSLFAAESRYSPNQQMGANEQAMRGMGSMAAPLYRGADNAQSPFLYGG